MAINIIDGFYLGSSTPIDSRFVVANAADRTAIVYKYDGLKVFQRDNRTTYIWNSTTSLWEVEGSGALSGTGTLNYVPRWASGSTLGTSSLYYSYPKIGLNNTSPQSLFDIKDPAGSESLALNIRRISGSQDSAVIGYNWYYNLVDQRVNSLKPSTKIEFGSSGSIFSIQTRTPSSASWQSILELFNSSGYNYLRSLDKGNFISGSVSFSSSATAYSSNNLVFVDGSFRTNSSNNLKTTYLTYNNSTFSKQVGYTINGVINAMTNVGLSPYNIASDDHFIVVRTTTSVTSGSLNLPTLSPTTSIGIGREITIQFDVQNLSNINNIMFVQSSTTIIGLDGQTTTPVIAMGDTIKFVSILENTTPKWKVIQHVKFNRVETWKLIGSVGSMDNGQPIPAFSPATSNVGGSEQPLRLRKVNEKYVHFQGTVQITGITLFVPLGFLLTLPTGYRPVLNNTFSTILKDSSNYGYKSELIISSGGLVAVVLNNGEIKSAGSRYDGASVPSGALRCYIDCMFAID
jgi:hypothetical protein